MTDIAQASARRLFVMQRCLLVLLLGGMLLLLLEIRFEHQAVLGEKWQAWIPLAYLSLLTVIIPVGTITIDTVGSKLLAVAFAGLVVVGVLGFWFHGDGKLPDRMSTIVSTIQAQPGQLLTSDKEDTSAPLLAPLSLVGLGTMGLLIAILRCASPADTRPVSRSADKGE